MTASHQVKAITGGAPSPLVILDSFLRMGQQPPPPVILCAIAEAELLGRFDLANDLVRAFVMPVIQAVDQPPEPTYDYAPAPAAYYQTSWPQAPVPQRLPVPAPMRWTSPVAPPAGGTVRRPHHPRHAANEARFRNPDGVAHFADPGVAHFADPTQGYPTTAHSAQVNAAPAQASRGQSPRALALAEDARVEILSRQAAAAQHAGQGTGRNAGTITVSGRSSPIAGIPTAQWGEFLNRVSRETPTFMTSRHVGQFRQRRDRLSELGIDPATIVNSPAAQYDALDADMSDAYGHADDSGLIAEYRGVTVEIPTSGTRTPIEVTLSGVLGVIQAAGLEGATQWLERPGDRERFPNTTAAFLRTNGVF